MSNVNKNITLEAKLISPPTYMQDMPSALHLVNGIRDGCIVGAVLDGDVIAVSCYQILCN